MYYAKIEENISSCNYIIEENAIYIDENVNIFEPNEQLFHEIIHYLQVVRNKSGKIKKMGLCNFGDFSIRGLGLNEAIVQYMSSRMVGADLQTINACGINLKTISPALYPILTNLMEQMIYLLGEKVIVEETIAVAVENEFEEQFYNTFEEKGNQIIKNFDRILDLKNVLASMNGEEERMNPEEEIANIYISTQEIMIRKYFDNIVGRLTEIEEIDFYIEKFLNYKKLIGLIKRENYTSIDFYEQYKDEIMKKFDKRLMKISKDKGKNTLSKYNNKLGRFFRKILSQL